MPDTTRTEALEALDPRAIVTIIHCLRVATEKFDEDAQFSLRSGYSRMAKGFIDQADKARALANHLVTEV